MWNIICYTNVNTTEHKVIRLHIFRAKNQLSLFSYYEIQKSFTSSNSSNL